MNRSLFRITAHIQLALAIVLATGCTPTQPFFLNESPDLEHYLDTATAVEYPTSTLRVFQRQSSRGLR